MSSDPADAALSELSPGDVGPMSRLHTKAFPDGQGWRPAEFESLLRQDSTHAYALLSDGALATFGVFQSVVDQVEILTLATDPDHRRKGLARRLLSALEPQFLNAGLKTWLLDVAEDNPGAITFYQTLGFTTDGRRPRYYKRLEGKRVDAILMSKPMARQVVR
ncbi:MAG: GNAT family N-acetyltransferase [Kamptonema sp. SIO1D9]|nr:GNAT family N-acetyltransferase [Kamptonema sp. SIO1D9]